MSTPELRIGRSYWLDRYAGRPPQFPPLRGVYTTDVAIVGGGLTGCVAACICAAAGISVVLLEAQRIGRGSTAASTALLLKEPDLSFRDLASRYGAARAHRIWTNSADSIRGLTRLLRTLRHGAALRASPSIQWARDTNSARELRREVAQRRAAGVADLWMTPDRLKRTTGIDAAGGIFSRGGAHMDPYLACLGLAELARARGARLCEHSPAQRITGCGHTVRIELERGEVRAAWAVIATGYATSAFRPLAGRFTMSNTYVIGTPPIGAGTRRRMGLHDVMLWDTSDPYHYARWTPDRRLLFGGGDRPSHAAASRQVELHRHAARLTTELIALYPALDGVSPEYAWEGLFATTPDGLPYIGRHRRYPRQLFALGYGGNGMAFAHLAAMILLRAVRGRSTDDDEFFGFRR